MIDDGAHRRRLAEIAMEEEPKLSVGRRFGRPDLHERLVTAGRRVRQDGKTEAAASRGATKDITAALRNAAPHGIDVYFDNVGDAHLEAAIEVARPFARFALCGMISQYNGEAPAGPRNILLVVGKRLTLKGFVINDHFQLMGELANRIAVWFAAGKLKARESVAEGIDSAPEAFLKLFFRRQDRQDAGETRLKWIPANGRECRLLKVFSTEETAASPGHMDNPTLAKEFVFDWLRRKLGSTKRSRELGRCM